MDLVIVRHAKATEKGGIPDPYRPLTSRGRRDALKLGQMLREAHVSTETIVMSPLVRAVETATLVAVGLGFEEGLEVAAELSTSHPAQAALEEVILPRAEMKSLLLVGHEPQLGLLLRLLLRGYAPAPRKASAICLTWDATDAVARFQWVLHPDLEGPSTRIEDLS